MAAVRLPRWLSATCLLLLLCVAGEARALFRAYLSVNGNDANPCTLPAPCRLLPAALDAVDSGGEIWMLDSGNFNTSTAVVSKSVMILAIPGALGSLVANGGNALMVGGAGIRVVLRNLSLGGLSGASGGGSGVFFTQGASLLIEDCRIFGHTSTGLVAYAPGAKLLVRDTLIRNNAAGINLEDSIDVTLERVQVVDNGPNGVHAGDGVQLSMSNSVVSGSGDAGVFARAISGGTTRVTLERTTLSRNFGVGFYSTASGPGSTVRAVIARSILTGNNHGVISSGSGSSVVLDGNTFAHNATAGTLSSESGVIRSRENNVFNYNPVDHAVAPTALPGQ